MKYVIYARMVIAGVKLLQALFDKRATPVTRESAIKKALATTNAIMPSTKKYTDDISEEDVSAIAELADILTEWTPEGDSQ